MSNTILNTQYNLLDASHFQDMIEISLFLEANTNLPMSYHLVLVNQLLFLNEDFYYEFTRNMNALTQQSLLQLLDSERVNSLTPEYLLYLDILSDSGILV